jgi:hypothetical protein
MASPCVLVFHCNVAGFALASYFVQPRQSRIRRTCVCACFCLYGGCFAPLLLAWSAHSSACTDANVSHSNMLQGLLTTIKGGMGELNQVNTLLLTRDAGSWCLVKKLLVGRAHIACGLGSQYCANYCCLPCFFWGRSSSDVLGKRRQAPVALARRHCNQLCAVRARHLVVSHWADCSFRVACATREGVSASLAVCSLHGMWEWRWSFETGVC